MDAVDELLRAHPELTCTETRRSWILLSGEQAWKIAKPAVRGPADGDTAQARRADCALEIERGEQYAPGVYLGLIPITRETDDRLRLGGCGEPVDWSIHMHRLPEADRADRRLRDGRLDDDDIRQIAEHVAHVHAASPVESPPSRIASPSAIASQIGWAFGRGDVLAPSDATFPGASEVEDWQRRFIDENPALFRQRLRDGRVRDGHGDLRLENIFVDDAGRVVAVDGAERAAAFRRADLASDVATLSLDLSLNGRVDLAERFIAAYAYVANDFDLYALIEFYESCRANLEAKTADQVQRHPHTSPTLRRSAERRALRYTRAAVAFGRRPFLPPMLVALSGLVATGKSSVGRAIARQIAAPVVSADAIRDFLLGADGADQRGSVHEFEWERSFRPDFRVEVYDEAFRRAALVLASGRPIVIDGCFGTHALRMRARDLANRFATPFFFVECTADEAVVSERLRARSLDAGIAPEAWQKISDDFRASWEPVDDLPQSQHIVLDTGQPLPVNVKTLEERLPVWPDTLP